MHGLRQRSKEMESYMRKCSLHNARGVRSTTVDTLTKLLGKYANSPSHRKIAEDVLKHHAIFIKNSVQDEENQSTISSSSDEERCQRAQKYAFDGEAQARSVPKGEGRQRQRRAHISECGLVSNFDTLCVTARVFTEAEIKHGQRTEASIRAIAQMAHRYLVWAKETANLSELQALLCSESPIEFARVLRGVFQPYTVKNHANSMCTVLDTILWNVHVRRSLGLQNSMKSALKSAKDVWERVKSASERRARMKQREHTRSGLFLNAPILLILEFLMENAPKCENYFAGLKTNLNDAQAMKLTRCVCACYMALHGQRLCAALNLKKTELQNASLSCGRYIIRIKRHKTSKFHGTANVALRIHQYNLMQRMAKQLSSGRDAVFPINQSGRASKELFAPLADYIRKKCNENLPITFNLIRKTVETNAFLCQGDQQHVRSKISSYLCHGKKVTDLHYSFKTDQRVLAESHSVEEVISALATLDLVRDGRVELPGPLGKITQKHAI